MEEKTAGLMQNPSWEGLGKKQACHAIISPMKFYTLKVCKTFKVSQRRDFFHART
jgi:hypothetical protein